MEKRIVKALYGEDGAICTEITVDGICDGITKPEDHVRFKRVMNAHWTGGYFLERNKATCCSNCGEEAIIDSSCILPHYELTDYCPWCGASMVEEDE